MAEIETSYLDQLKVAIQTNQVAAKSRAAGNWFRSIVNRTKGAFSDKLPWYDTFPLVFPIEEYNNGFLGLNFHYLHPKDRAILMDQLKMFANNKKYDETTKLRLTYNMLKGFSKIKRAKPTVHRYLNSKINSKFVLVNADEWEVALFLPVEKSTQKGSMGA